jgi:molybdenum cofactor biosynthesis protein B
MNKDSSERHRKEAASLGAVAVALLTVSDSRTVETDVNAHYLQTELEEKGHTISQYKLVKDDPEQIRSALEELAGGLSEVILVNGGSGISKRDNTIDVLEKLLDKELRGFGELFRFLSYQEIGSAAMLSRATAGLFNSCIVFAVPGSPKAVRLAWEKLIQPELKHLVYEAKKQA